MRYEFEFLSGQICVDILLYQYMLAHKAGPNAVLKIIHYTLLATNWQGMLTLQCLITLTYRQ